MTKMYHVVTLDFERMTYPYITFCVSLKYFLNFLLILKHMPGNKKENQDILTERTQVTRKVISFSWK